MQRQCAFEAQARQLGLQPRDPCIGRDVNDEWDHLRLILDAMPLCLPGMRVLEYVEHAERAAVQREIDRVLKPGGVILLTGTSNRLWPRDARSGRWLVNYPPRALDRRWGRPLQRGVWPWSARHGFGLHYDNLDTADANNFFARSRAGLGMSPTLLAHNMSGLLQQQSAPSAASGTGCGIGCDCGGNA